ncbi:MAG: hypothetical protein ACTSSL_09995, partial [Candidatus Heimdallarchaeaceae archaeon]
HFQPLICFTAFFLIMTPNIGKEAPHNTPISAASIYPSVVKNWLEIIKMELNTKNGIIKKAVTVPGL